MEYPFLTQAQGVGGAVKARYEDFIVEEIGPAGRVCEAENPADWEFPVMEIPANEKKQAFLHVDLEKINQDQHAVVKRLARFLGVGQKRIGYAGIKDKRAVTCQRISIFRPPLERLEKFHGRMMGLRAPFWEEEKIDIGDLKGNRFALRVRGIKLEKVEAKKRLNALIEEISQKGVPNYFGRQRFGGARYVTHLVGLALAKRDVKEAAMKYLAHPSDSEPEEVQEARKLAVAGDFKGALHAFPKKWRFERAMLHHLAVNPKDFAGAFSKLPKRVRILFTHALQSFLFNGLLAARLKQGLGLHALKGEPAENGVALLLCPGYESAFAPGKAGALEKEVLRQSGLVLGDFKMKVVAECSSKGMRRPALVFPKKMRVVALEKGENGVDAVLSFELEKGCYATTVLREITKHPGL